MNTEWEIAVANMMEPWALEIRRRVALIEHARSGAAAEVLRVAAAHPKGTVPAWAVEEAKEAMSLLAGER